MGVKQKNKPKPGSSDGRAGDSRSKDPRFNTCLDPKDFASKDTLYV